MSRTAAVLFGLALVLVVLYLISAAPVKAARSQAQCWFEDGWLYAVGLPTTYPFAVTADPYPVGTTHWTTDGTFSVQTSLQRAYVWVRGHGPSLIKAGPGLSDYRVIAYCEVAG